MRLCCSAGSFLTSKSSRNHRAYGSVHGGSSRLPARDGLGEAKSDLISNPEHELGLPRQIGGVADRPKRH
jgi:hypothetical protein